ncbi:hypothetical protein QNA08_14090 [Chelatococcus sp. SYSU_G07232]|uniref:DUF3008 domain-containing protein n=1 Tax=Chelatococcus albus TaxID=3047466 RepID=A0ABT7AJ08_9HYPH|nr:hypothetical protein [Chelatococcus sp. SYSU_G07232]MDJ1159365.1 hypothetical protein [Chelatococcus sp. SYSU_G07232]
MNATGKGARAKARGKADDKKRTAQNEKAHLDEALDEALMESFPASDPVASIEPLTVGGAHEDALTVRSKGKSGKA